MYIYSYWEWAYYSLKKTQRNMYLNIEWDFRQLDSEQKKTYSFVSIVFIDLKPNKTHNCVK